MKLTLAVFALLLAAFVALDIHAQSELQGLSNPPRCPLDHKPVDSAPVYLMALSPTGVMDGSSLTTPVLICPRDGVLFAVAAPVEVKTQ